jgi:hypothetical protein
MCRQCYRIKVELRALHLRLEHAKKFGTPTRGDGLIPIPLKVEYMTAVAMAEDAQREGRRYGSLYRNDITSLDLEHELSFICTRFLKKDLYSNDACFFDCFTIGQKRLLLYFLAKMSREYLRRKRRIRARNKVAAKEVNQVLRKRSPGTYRVEKDPAVMRRRR